MSFQSGNASKSVAGIAVELILHRSELSITVPVHFGRNLDSVYVNGACVLPVEDIGGEVVVTPFGKSIVSWENVGPLIKRVFGIGTFLIINPVVEVLLVHLANDWGIRRILESSTRFLRILFILVQDLFVPLSHVSHDVLDFLVDVERRELLEDVHIHELLEVGLWEETEVIVVLQDSLEEVKVLVIEQIVYELGEPLRVLVEELAGNEGLWVEYLVLGLVLFLIEELGIHFVDFVELIVGQIVEFGHSQHQSLVFVLLLQLFQFGQVGFEYLHSELLFFWSGVGLLIVFLELIKLCLKVLGFCRVLGQSLDHLGRQAIDQEE